MNPSHRLFASLFVAALVACSSASSTPAHDDGPPPSTVADAGKDVTPTPTPPSVPSTPDGGSEDAAPVPGPSLVVPASELAIASPGAPAGQSSAYALQPDPATPEGGAPSMLLASTAGATSGTFAASTAVRPVDERFVGRRYRMRAKIKTEGATAGWLWWRVDASSGFDLDNMLTPEKRAIVGTRDWLDVSLVLDVPEDATRFAFGSGLVGEGKVWVSAITFEEVPTSVPTTPHFSGGN